MPKYALANWLYFGYDELPRDVREAFDQSTRIDRMLVSHARLTRICFCYSDKQNHPVGKDPSTSQLYVKGNIMVMPQDVTHLNTVMPPSAREFADTVCAIFVGHEKPSRLNIRQMHPMLV